MACVYICMERHTPYSYSSIPLFFSSNVWLNQVVHICAADCEGSVNAPKNVYPGAMSQTTNSISIQRVVHAIPGAPNASVNASEGVSRSDAGNALLLSLSGSKATSTQLSERYLLAVKLVLAHTHCKAERLRVADVSL